MEELWLPVVGHEDQYLVSNVGRVQCQETGKILSLALLDDRYVAAWLPPKLRKVHHLVAEAFICPRPEGLFCLHRDDDKFNNTPENLYWGTLEQNQRDCTRNGHRRCQKGTENNSAKLTPETVRAIRVAAGTCKELGRRFSCSPMSISLIKRRKIWAHLPD